MASTIFEEKKKKGYIGVILIIAIMSGGIWFGQKYLVKPLPLPPPPPKKKIIEINTEILGKDFMQELQAFKEIAPLEGAAGRKNPFLPY